MSNTQQPDVKDSNDPRQCLLVAALRLFAEKGFVAATTREICEAAGANISAIRYYFGDKAGLYRAVYSEPLIKMPARGNRQRYANLPIAEALELFFSDFLTPFKLGDDIGLVMKLHYREMLEPTGAWQKEIETEIKPQHEELLSLLKQHLGVTEVDIDMQRLAFAIVGMGVHMFVGQDIVAAIAPQMLTTPEAVDILAKRLSGYALAMLNNEAQRRAEEGAV
ncbi:CerR family C-terminal domain-containing protein [Methylomonas sp. AM2-LC]|uniref:CerR family C-terminal domain-containing protein n=1 Tax=Methylomonas sp. AM2-LC TaxID=3153301 RepID=UPI003267F20F